MKGNLSTGNMANTGGSSVNSKGTSPRTPITNGGGGGGGPNTQMKPGTRRNVTLIGKTVRITQGPYKGYVGIVKDATDATARVELHTKCQTISVDLVRLTIVDLARGASVNRTPGGGSFFATPSHVAGSQTPTASSSSNTGGGGRTPMYGSQTPMHDGSRTPHYGSATPRYDGSATPNADRSGGGNAAALSSSTSTTSAWDPTSMNTPRNDFEEDWDEQPAPGSASLNPTTPGYQAETPIDGGGGGGGGMVGIASLEHRSVGPFTPGSALNYVTHSPYAANPSPLDAPIINIAYSIIKANRGQIKCQRRAVHTHPIIHPLPFKTIYIRRRRQAVPHMAMRRLKHPAPINTHSIIPIGIWTVYLCALKTHIRMIWICAGHKVSYEVYTVVNVRCIYATWIRL